MTLVVPNVGETQALTKLLNQALTLKLYSNNITPAEGDTNSTYTEVSGGGYANKALAFGTWTLTSGDPSFGLYPAQDFAFTGTTGAPGTIYGYYVIDGSSNLLWAERFPSSVLPFSPISGSLVRIVPRIEAS